MSRKRNLITLARAKEGGMMAYVGKVEMGMEVVPSILLAIATRQTLLDLSDQLVNTSYNETSPLMQTPDLSGDTILLSVDEVPARKLVISSPDEVREFSYDALALILSHILLALTKGNPVTPSALQTEIEVEKSHQQRTNDRLQI
jgi:hypothetical protein